MSLQPESIKSAFSRRLNAIGASYALAGIHLTEMLAILSALTFQLPNQFI